MTAREESHRERSERDRQTERETDRQIKREEKGWETKENNRRKKIRKPQDAGLNILRTKIQQYTYVQ